jgi:hypothetical protein
MDCAQRISIRIFGKTSRIAALGGRACYRRYPGTERTLRRSIHRAQAAIRQRIRSAIDLHEINKGVYVVRAFRTIGLAI